MGKGKTVRHSVAGEKLILEAISSLQAIGSR